MTKVPMLAAALLLGVSTAALAGAATDDASRANASAAADATAGAGSSTAPGTASTELRARALIARQGYDMVTDLQRTRDGYEALAVKDGKVMEVAVDNSGRVRRVR
jgi:hypothetical protein